MKSTNDNELEKLNIIKAVIDREIYAGRLQLLPIRFKNVKILNVEVVDANIERRGGYKWDRPVLYFNTDPAINESGYVITHIRPQWFQFENESVWAEISSIKKS